MDYFHISCMLEDMDLKYTQGGIKKKYFHIFKGLPKRKFPDPKTFMSFTYNTSF